MTLRLAMRRALFAGLTDLAVLNAANVAVRDGFDGVAALAMEELRERAGGAS